MSQIKRQYNWKRDKLDPRDHLYKVGHPLAPQAALPSVVDLSPACSPVRDQGEMGCCSGFALAGAYEYLELMDLKAKMTLAGAPEMFDLTQFSEVSELFIYYGERVLEGTVNEDSGAEIRDGIKVLARLGVCRETLWPYADTNLLKQPVQAAYDEAAQHKVIQYQRLNILDDIRHCLASGFPVAFGFDVYANFESDYCAKTGDLQMPASGEPLVGGHAVLDVGYDDNARKLKIRNSWGPEWGLAGYFTMPYEYVDQGLASDFWTIRK